MNRIKTIEMLRGALDVIEKPEFPDDVRIDVSMSSVRVWCDTPQQFGKAALALGEFQKDADDGFLNARRYFGGVLFEVTIQREKTCTKKVVGTRVIPAESGRVETHTTVIEARPERVEEIVEWDCPESFIALAEEPEDGTPAPEPGEAEAALASANSEALPL